MNDEETVALIAGPPLRQDPRRRRSVTMGPAPEGGLIEDQGLG